MLAPASPVRWLVPRRALDRRSGRRSLSSPGDPHLERPFRRAVRRGPARAAAGARGAAPDRRRRGVPRPARASPCSRAPGRAGTPAGRYLTADPVAVLTEPAAGGDPFAVARRLLARLAARRRPARRGGLARAAVPRRARRLPRLRARRRARAPAGAAGGRPGPAAPPPRAPRLDDRLGPPDRARRGWPVARSTATRARLSRRLAEVRERLRLGLATGSRRGRRATRRPAPTTRPAELASGRRSIAPRTRRASRPIRDRIAGGEIYQANLTRRLETPFDGDPWPLYRRLRTGDPSLFSAYLDLGAARRVTAPCSAVPRRARGRSSRRRPSRSSRSTRARPRLDRPDQGHAAARPDARRGPGPRPRAARARRRTGPRT